MFNFLKSSRKKFLKTEKQILRDRPKEKIKELIKINQINYVKHKHGTALNRTIKLKDEKIISTTKKQC